MKCWFFGFFRRGADGAAVRRHWQAEIGPPVRKKRVARMISACFHQERRKVNTPQKLSVRVYSRQASASHEVGICRRPRKSNVHAASCNSVRGQPATAHFSRQKVAGVKFGSFRPEHQVFAKSPGRPEQHRVESLTGALHGQVIGASVSNRRPALGVIKLRPTGPSRVGSR